MAWNGNDGKNKPKKEIKNKKIIKIIIIVIAVILLFIGLALLYTNNDNVRDFFDKYIFMKEVDEENLPTIDLEDVTVSNVYAYKGYIAIVSNNTITMYNKSGNEEYSLDIEVSNPVFESSGNYLCVAEKGGQKIYLINNKNIVWQKDIEGEISSINVNKNGFVSVVISRYKL